MREVERLRPKRPALGTPFLGFVNYLGSCNGCLCQSMCPLPPCNVVKSAAKRGLLGAGLALAPSLVSLAYFIASSMSKFMVFYLNRCSWLAQL